MVEIDEDNRDYGTGDGGAVAGPSKEQDDNVSISNINIEKAEVGCGFMISCKSIYLLFVGSHVT